MAERDGEPPKDDQPPKNVIHFGNVVGVAIAQQLNDFYGELLREELPEELSDLARKLAAAMARDKEKA